MRKKLTALILLMTVPIVLSLSFFLSQRSFSLLLENEKQRTQMTQSMVLREIQGVMPLSSFSQAAAYARQYRHYYAAQGIELIFCWDKKPLAGALLPHERYEELLLGGRRALLDTQSAPERYAIAEPVGADLTMILLRDFSDLYLFKRDIHLLSLGAAAAASALLTAAALLLSGVITRPIRRLTEAASLLSQDAENTLPLPTSRRDEIGALARAFFHMQEAISAREKRLEAESASRQALLDALSHEMRTPLTSLLGNARLLQRPLEEEVRNEIVQSMVRETLRLSDMDQQLMRLTALRHEEIENELVCVDDLLSETAERLRQQAADIHLEVIRSGSFLSGDRALLSLLADNLALNALHASSPGMTVRLQSLPNGFLVSDEGIGMTEDALQHMFEPFWKADKARTRKHGGAGLGLSLCRRIAQLHHGTLDFSSAPGKGTRAAFTIPLHPVDDSVTPPVA